MEFGDLTTLITIGIAIFVLIKLRSILGKRIGHQNPPTQPYRERSKTHNQTSGNNVVTLSGQNELVSADENEPDIYAEIDQMFEKGSELNNKLRKLKDMDAMFSPKEFLQGAKQAYEMIVTAFAEGDRQTLKNLLSQEVYDGFSNAIEEREQDNLKVQFSFVGIDEEKISEAKISGKNTSLTVYFVSQIISATYDKDDNLVDGNKDQIAQIIDLWSFSRNIHSRDPNWKLIATESGN